VALPPFDFSSTWMALYARREEWSGEERERKSIRHFERPARGRGV